VARVEHLEEQVAKVVEVDKELCLLLNYNGKKLTKNQMKLHHEHVSPVRSLSDQ